LILKQINSAPRLSIGDKKYLIPSETAANAEEAKSYCESRNMDIVSFETPKESDSVFDFVGALGLEKNMNETAVVISLYQKAWI
jgi:hypothetical protein